MYRMHYAGQTFEIHDSERRQRIEEAAAKAADTGTPEWLTIRTTQYGVGRFLFGSGIGVAFTGMSESDVVR